MIKRLFRTWLRYKLVRMIGERETNFEEVFEWIYNSPIWEWKIRLYLSKRYDHLVNIHSESLDCIVDLDRAQSILDFIKK